MAIKNGNGLAYKGDVETFSVYELFVNGIVVLEASVDNNDPELKIFIGKQGATFAQVTMGIEGQLTETKGRAQKGVHEVPSEDSEAPAGLHEHIDGCSVQSYIYRRALNFVVDLHLASLKPVEDKPES